MAGNEPELPGHETLPATNRNGLQKSEECGAGMKRYHFSADDQMDEALLLLKRVGEALQHPMVVIRYDNTIPYANPHFLAFTKDRGPGFLIRSADQVSDLLPEETVLARVWQTGEPCTTAVKIPPSTAPVTMACDCIPFRDLHGHISMVTLIYRERELPHTIQ